MWQVEAYQRIVAAPDDVHLVYFEMAVEVCFAVKF